MHWVVSRALSREPGFEPLMQAIRAQGRAHTMVSKPPFVDFLHDPEAPLNEKREPVPIMLDIEGPVFVAGTTSMEHVSNAHGWTPGYITAPNQQDCMKAWGEHMLNHGATFGPIGSIQPPAEGEFFIRPNEDIKNFAGRVLTAEKFEGWRENLLNIKGWTTLPPETIVMMAPLQPIYAEYRCIVVNGRYVTGSRYRTGGRTEYSPEVGNMIIDFVNERVSEWNPRPAVAVDVAHTAAGLKVIETNSVSSAGFYSIDMDIFVREISALA